MINLTGKSVFVKTQEEYENILNIARLQGFDKWSDKVSLSSRNIKLPNILIFKDNGTVAYWSDKGVLEASEIIEYEEKISADLLMKLTSLGVRFNEKCVGKFSRFLAEYKNQE